MRRRPHAGLTRRFGVWCGELARGVYDRVMLAVVWHYWIAVALVLGAVVPAVIGLSVQYLRKTQGPKYPGTRAP